MNIFYFFTLNDTNISSCAFSLYPPWPMAVTKKENGSPPIRPCVLLPRPFTVMLIFFIEFLMKCMLIILLSLVRNHRNYIPLFWNLREIMLWKSVFWRMPRSFQNQVKHMLLRKLAELYDMAFVFLSVLRPFICSCKKIHGPSLSNSCMKIHESFALVFIEIFSRYILFAFLLFFSSNPYDSLLLSFYALFPISRSISATFASSNLKKASGTSDNTIKTTGNALKIRRIFPCMAGVISAAAV